MIKIIDMSIESGSVCINCENLSASFRCSKHEIDVDLDNVCSDHSLKRSISKLSNCLNCEKYSTKKCPNPSFAAEGLLCFSWS